MFIIVYPRCLHVCREYKCGTASGYLVHAFFRYPRHYIRQGRSRKKHIKQKRRSIDRPRGVSLRRQLIAGRFRKNKLCRLFISCWFSRRFVFGCGRLVITLNFGGSSLDEISVRAVPAAIYVL